MHQTTLQMCAAPIVAAHHTSQVQILAAVPGSCMWHAPTHMPITTILLFGHALDYISPGASRKQNGRLAASETHAHAPVSVCQTAGAPLCCSHVFLPRLAEALVVHCFGSVLRCASTATCLVLAKKALWCGKRTTSRDAPDGNHNGGAPDDIQQGTSG